MIKDQQQILQLAYQVFMDEANGIHEVAHNLGLNFVEVVLAIFNCKGKVIVTGIGKSGHIAHKIAATFASTGTPAFFVHPAEALHGDLGMISANDIVLAISYSGESDEVLAIIPAILHKQVPIIAITGNSNSSLARSAKYNLSAHINKEACPLNLAPTTSTTVALVLGDALAISLLKLRGFKPEDFALSHPGGNLGRRLLTKVTDIMHTGTHMPCVGKVMMLKDIVLEISKKSLGFTTVVDNELKLQGIITDGDLRRVLDGNVEVAGITAEIMMNPYPKVLRIDDLAMVAVELMEKYKITGFVVVDHNDKLAGVFNLHDLFRAKLI